MRGFISRVVAALLVTAVPAFGQSSIPAKTTNASIVIATGATFQQVLAAAPPSGTTARRSLTIQNNNTTTDNCWVFIGTGTPTAATSILLTPGGSYARYFPYVPNDLIRATCTTTSNTLYVDYN